MGITVAWDLAKQQTIFVTYQIPWTWVDFNKAMDEMKALLDGADHKVDVVFDVRSAGSPPPGAMSNFMRAAKVDHPNAGQLIFIAPGIMTRFIQGLIDIIRHATFGTFNVPPFTFVTTLEEAQALVAASHQDSAATASAGAGSSK